ncbi:MAG: CpaD family pilus assembly protein [Sneathiella sp.]|nr:CpaD family pilus assembly protein [Sneathiella sp.]
MQRTIIGKSVTWTSVLVLGALLTACSSSGLPGSDFKETATTQNAMLDKKINVERVTPTVVVNFATGRAGMNDLERGKLLGFIEAQQIGFGEKVEVELPPFQGTGGLSEQRFGGLAAYLQERGFAVTPRVTNETAENSLRVYFVKYIATVDPICEQGWYKPKHLGHENLPLPFMGCSTASALAGMVANPKDLVDPAAMSPADGERAAKAIEKYRSGAGSGSTAASGQ